ncbi:MAG: PAS domain S-box protein [Desulfobulbaceae bacterium]|nr:PAS domain S-box protein [Desulfobulbaceae bacterium]
MRTSQKIMAGFLVTLTLTAALAFYADFASRRSLEEAISHELLILAQETMKRIDLTIHDRIMYVWNYAEQAWILTFIAKSNQSFAALDSPEDFMNRNEREWISAPPDSPSPVMGELEDNELSRRLRQHLINFFVANYGYSSFPNLFVTNRYGAVIASTGRTRRYRQDKEPWWQTARQQGMSLEDIAYDAPSDSYGIAVALRLGDSDGNFLGVVRAIINVGPIVKTAEIATGRYQSARTRLLTRDGKIIYRTRPYRFLQDFSYTDLLSRLQGEKGFFIGNEQNVQRFYSYARSTGKEHYPGFGWILLVSTDADEVLASAEVLRTRIAVVSILLIMAGMVFALVLSRTINRSLAALTAGAERIGKGEFDFRMELAGNDEFGQLASAFNSMVSNLKEVTASRDDLNAEIAERNKAEKALRESENRFRATFEQAAVGIALVSPQGGWLSVNRKLCAIVGYPEEKLRQLIFQDITHPDDLDADLEFHRQMLAGEIFTYSLEKRYIRLDGSLVWTNLTVFLVRDEDGVPAYFVSVIEDIDQRKKIEQERDRLSMELARKNHELEQIIYVTSHDLRSPLVNVQGFSRELAADIKSLLSLWQNPEIPAAIRQQAEPLLNEDIPESLQFIEKGISKMDALLSGLLRLSRLGRASPTLEECDMNRLLTDIVTTMGFQINEAGVEVIVDGLPTCLGDRDQLNQLFSNLLGNALKYLDPGRPGRINVNGVKDKGRSVYCVSDNGVGIAREHQGKIFEIFHRLNPAASEGEGLGLAIVNRILDRLDGKIWVESEEGKGSSFYVSLPGWKGGNRARIAVTPLAKGEKEK